MLNGSVFLISVAVFHFVWINSVFSWCSIHVFRKLHSTLIGQFSLPPQHILTLTFHVPTYIMNKILGPDPFGAPVLIMVHVVFSHFFVFIICTPVVLCLLMKSAYFSSNKVGF